MNNIMIKLSLVLFLFIAAPASHALSDTYYSTGEDLDYLVESKSTQVIEEIEYELRRFVLYRKLEDIIFNLVDEYPGILSN